MSEMSLGEITCNIADLWEAVEKLKGKQAKQEAHNSCAVGDIMQKMTGLLAKLGELETDLKKLNEQVYNLQYRHF